MTTNAYNVRAIVTDGPVTAPRWMHHLLKVMTSLSVFVLLLVVATLVPWLSPLLCAYLASLGWFAIVWLHESVAPSDRAPHTAWEHLADALTDGACACVTLAAGYWLVGDRAIALFVLAACVVAWTLGHRDARP